MKYVLTIFACFFFISAFAQMVNPSDTFAYETFYYLKKIDSSDFPREKKNNLKFEKIKNYLGKNPQDIWYGQQLLWFTKYFEPAKIDTLFNLFDSPTQNKMAMLFTPLKSRARVLPGNSFPEMILVDSLKKPLKIADLKGKVVLIDIWASWCQPCRAEMPKLISLYDKYKNKGFVVIPISVDDNKEKWLKAIRDDALPWVHFCDLVDMENNILLTKWGVNSFPYNFLIDKDGILVDKEVSIDDLERELVKLL